MNEIIMRCLKIPSAFSKEKIVVIGAGGQCKAVLDILLDDETYDIAGIVDDVSFSAYRGVPVIGSDSVLLSVFKKGVKKAFIAIGNNFVRRRLYCETKNMGFEFINVISKNAIVSPRASLGEGIVIMHGAIVNIDCTIGHGVIINTNASVDHECSIGDFSHIAPSATLCGCVKVGENTLIGAGAVVTENITIGNNATVGAGAVVIRNVENDESVVGVPARPMPKKE